MSHTEIKITHDHLSADNKITERRIVGYFSVNGEGVYCADARQLKYFYGSVPKNTKPVNFNLNNRLDLVTKKDNDRFKTWNKLTNMFLWISLNGSRLLSANEIVFVTFRGNMTKVMCSPYVALDDWTICARYNNGIIYLNSFDTENDIQNRRRASNFELRCQTWGFKFEQYLLTHDPKYAPYAKCPLNENEEFCCVLDRTLGGHRIIFGAEMDGILSRNTLDLKNSNYDLSQAEFIELKTNRTMLHQKQYITFYKHKMLKWWCQSYLSGIKTIVCGFRDDAGLVTSLQSYQVSDLPSLGRNYWNKDVCLNFCIRFFDFVKRVVIETNHGEKNEFWKFDLTPNVKVSVSKITEDSSIYKTGFMDIKVHNTS